MLHDARFGDWYAGQLLADLDRETMRGKAARCAVFGLLDGPGDPDDDEEEDEDDGA